MPGTALGSVQGCDGMDSHSSGIGTQEVPPNVLFSFRLSPARLWAEMLGLSLRCSPSMEIEEEVRFQFQAPILGSSGGPLCTSLPSGLHE